MARLVDIWSEIEKGRGFKQPHWDNYFYISDDNMSGVLVREIFKDSWELEPLPKKELKLFQAVYRLKVIENGKISFYYNMPDRLYRDKEDAKIFKPCLGRSQDVELVQLIPVNLLTPIFEEGTE